jgi:hypothetical protein
VRIENKDPEIANKIKIKMQIIYSLWIVCLVIDFQLGEITCDDDKIKRDISYNGYGKNKNNFDKGGIKDEKLPLSPVDEVFLALESFGLKYDKNAKTTVEYWPPDMDKEKFYKVNYDEKFKPFFLWNQQKPADTNFEFKQNVPVTNSGVVQVTEETPRENFNFKNYYQHHPIVEVNNEPNDKFVPSSINFNKQSVQEDFYPSVQNDDFAYYHSTKKPRVLNHQHSYAIYDTTEKYIPIFTSYFQNDISTTIKPEIVAIPQEYESTYKTQGHTSTKKVPKITHPPNSDVKIYNDNFYHVTTDSALFLNEAAMTDSGPVTFPITQGTITTKLHSQQHESANNKSPRLNKKRKLKKKVKNSSLAQLNVEKIATSTPIQVLSNEYDVTTSNEASNSNAPVIDNVSMHYSDIINNLSNLTELTYNNNNSENEYFKKFRDDGGKISSQSTGNNGYRQLELLHVGNSEGEIIIETDLPSTEISTTPFIINIETDSFNISSNSSNSDSSYTKQAEMRDDNNKSSQVKVVDLKIENDESDIKVSSVPVKKLIKVSKSRPLSTGAMLNQLKKSMEEYESTKITTATARAVKNVSTTTTAASSVMMSSTTTTKTLKENKSSTSEVPKIHRSRFSLKQNIKPKYIDNLKEQSTTSEPTSASSSSLPAPLTSSFRPMMIVKSTTSPSWMKKNNSTSSSSSSKSTKSPLLSTTVNFMTIKPKDIMLTGRQHRLLKSRNIRRNPKTTTKSPSTINKSTRSTTFSSRSRRINIIKKP